MRGDNRLQVFYGKQLVGTLALTREGMAAFSYDEDWLVDGFSISPFSLPLKKHVFVPTKPYFHGLFGVFADSLPDAWGNLLLDRLLKQRGINPDELSVLDRLAIVGSSGMGALTYQPERPLTIHRSAVDLDVLAEECRKVLRAEYAENLDELYLLGGSSGGARPKIMTQIDDEEWLIKFSMHMDGKDSGKMEYDYARCAKACGIQMSEIRLFPSKTCGGYFGTKRFDRVLRDEGRCNCDSSEQKRIHMVTVAALLELDFGQPSLDYHALMKITKILTRDDSNDLENMFRRMCFNVFAHNRDDHSKNFSFLYEEERKMWRLSPAYDLTYSRTYFGEHTTTVDGNGRNPGRKELIAVGVAAGLRRERSGEIIDEIENCVGNMLGEYLE